MTDRSVDTLNDVLPYMIDSCLGYEKAHDILDDNPNLRNAIRGRYESRKALVDEMIRYVTDKGAEPAGEGSFSGSAHRSFMDIANIFEDDIEAAMGAIDTGEVFLQNKLKEALDENGLDPSARDLLKKALEDANTGERLGDAYQK